MGLIAEQFFSDPELKKSLAVILERLKHYQSQLISQKEASASEKETFHNLLDGIQNCRGNLFFPYLSSGLGNGALIELADGSVKYDFINGIGVHWGHSVPELIEASLIGALKDTVMQGNLQQDASAVELYQLLQKHSGLDQVFLTSSGAMAIENALKISFQYKQPAKRVLAFENCFSGRTLAAASITDKAKYREGLPITIGVDYIPFYDESKPDSSTQKSLSKLRTYLNRYPNDHACMIMELVQGEGGFNVAPKEFYEAIMKELQSHDIPIIVDEIQTFGRTPQLFAFQHFGLEQYVDIVTIGKVAQVCATMYREKYKPKPGLISQTFTSSATAIETSKVIIKSLVNNDYYGENGKIQTMNAYFSKQFEGLKKKYPNDLAGPYGIGSMIAFTPLDGSRDRVLELLHLLFKKGLICFIAGNNPVKLRFLLPLGAMKESDIDAACEIIDHSLNELLSQ